MKTFKTLLLLLTLPAVAHAQFVFTANNDGSLNLAQYTGSGGTVVIPDTTNGLRVTSIGDSAFWDCTNVINVTIGTNVINIGNTAFIYSGLTNVMIPNSVTNIGVSGFGECASLMAITVDPANSFYSSTNGVLFNKSQTTLIQYPGGLGGSYAIPNSVTNIGDWALSLCTHLTSVTIPNSVTGIGLMAISWCNSLTNIMIGTNVVNISSYAFFYSGLTSVTIPNSVTNIGDLAFYSCPLMAITVDENNLNYASVGGVLFNKSQTTLIQYPEALAGNYTISNSVTDIGTNAFGYCTSLTSVYFEGNAPRFVGAGVFTGDDIATVYYLPGTTGWGTMFGGRPTELWNPTAENDTSFGVQANRFGFNITGSSNLVIVVEGCTNLANPVWFPLSTNMLNTFIGTNGMSYFSDPQWTNYPGRFYRFRSP